MSAAPYTLRFTEWRCGHHGQRPADIPVHSVEQAQLILQAIANAMSQPGHARAAIFNETAGACAYATDDFAEAFPTQLTSRTVIYHGSNEEIAELLKLAAAFDYAYGGELEQWDGSTYLDGMEVITTLTTPEIEAAIAPVEWWDEGRRFHVCETPPVLKPAAELLTELREANEDLVRGAA
ncbi:hypothetical protein J2W34_000762 [Variovorax boronicumulans]|uniref:hypothetical protein n=1 Tax=Variovorax boronicumulans TaxID=436515 RepID=UPI002780C24E|nr:hypothetical protein [Variovorax boronicumulans]MDQ0068988.1 hypothetical protein [Variovorax boronicumulans]